MRSTSQRPRELLPGVQSKESNLLLGHSVSSGSLRRSQEHQPSLNRAQGLCRVLGQASAFSLVKEAAATTWLRDPGQCTSQGRGMQSGKPRRV